ncbi:hypothetical protein H257_08144 [Aphanomyces astaci]|uniref:Reverse transcriptase/retrotransposon-derived protein RNase H-like domain-containing protein n=1 Tax=Aphanomyces astaci TaxID=112090 RepID=W4GI98_APHAT|nr:hypothetical protein H257_08144 [Aphanomyces astaci]ETV78653.1 hypothetical protein H257_08144 [Aphanomyces astaci]|eukprot:XP_009832234.1 hypothetical protein H257_08144 [Aphanomyces astaci]
MQNGFQWDRTVQAVAVLTSLLIERAERRQEELFLISKDCLKCFDRILGWVMERRGKQGKMTKVSKRIWVPRGGPAGRPVASENPVIRPDGEEKKEQTDDPSKLPVPREDPRMGREETRTDGVEVKTRWKVLRSVKNLCEKTRRCEKPAGMQAQGEVQRSEKEHRVGKLDHATVGLAELLISRTILAGLPVPRGATKDGDTVELQRATWPELPVPCDDAIGELVFVDFDTTLDPVVEGRMESVVCGSASEALSKLVGIPDAHDDVVGYRTDLTAAVETVFAPYGIAKVPPNQLEVVVEPVFTPTQIENIITGDFPGIVKAVVATVGFRPQPTKQVWFYGRAAYVFEALGVTASITLTDLESTRRPGEVWRLNWHFFSLRRELTRLAFHHLVHFAEKASSCVSAMQRHTVGIRWCARELYAVKEDDVVVPKRLIYHVGSDNLVPLKVVSLNCAKMSALIDSGASRPLVRLKTAERPPILAYPDFELPFIVYVDGCSIAVGTVWMQKQNGRERAIAYASQVVEPNPETVGLVPFSVGLVVQVWIKLNQRYAGSLGLPLAEFTFTVTHRPGVSIGTDGCGLYGVGNSCYSCQAELTVSDETADTMRTAPTDTDPEETLMERMGLDVLSPEVTATGRRHTEQYGRGLLRTERATGIPLDNSYNVPSDLLTEEQAKDTFIRVIKAYLLEEAVPFDRDAIKPSRVGYWKGWREDVAEYCRLCVHCGASKGSTPWRNGKLQRMPVYRLKGPFSMVVVDALGPFPPTANGNKFVQIIVAYFTRWPRGRVQIRDVYLPRLLFAYRTAYQSTLGVFPVFCLFGLDPIQPLDIVFTNQDTPWKLDDLPQWRWKQFACDGRTKQADYQPADSVWLHQYFRKSTDENDKPIKKLACYWYGPYRIHSRQGENTFRIYLPSHPDWVVPINVDRLNKFHGYWSRAKDVDIPERLLRRTPSDNDRSPAFDEGDQNDAWLASELLPESSFAGRVDSLTET